MTRPSPAPAARARGGAFDRTDGSAFANRLRNSPGHGRFSAYMTNNAAGSVPFPSCAHRIGAPGAPSFRRRIPKEGQAP